MACKEFVVRDDPKLPDDSGKVPKYGWNGWQLDYRTGHLLSN